MWQKEDLVLLSRKPPEILNLFFLPCDHKPYAPNP